MEVKELFTEVLKDTIIDTFTKIFNVTPIIEIKPPEEGPKGAEKLLAAVGFVGDLEGSLVIILNLPDACKAVSAMLYCDIEEISQDVLDGTGEIANIITGGLRTKLAESNHKFQISIPTVIQGVDPLRIMKLGGTDTISMHIDCVEFDFDLVLSYTMQDEKQNNQP